MRSKEKQRKKHILIGFKAASTLSAKGGVSAVAPTSPTYIWSIPTTELVINKWMVGNGN